MSLLAKVRLQPLPGGGGAITADGAAHHLIVCPRGREERVGEKESPPCDRHTEHCSSAYNACDGAAVKVSLYLMNAVLGWGWGGGWGLGGVGFVLHISYRSLRSRSGWFVPVVYCLSDCGLLRHHGFESSQIQNVQFIKFSKKLAIRNRRKTKRT